MGETLTIGQLARRAGIRTSALRYYEELGLLKPAARTGNGYRSYNAEAEQTLRFIQRAQRLGFSLGDIRVMLDSGQVGLDTTQTILRLAEERFVALEKELTSLLIQRHELALFLDDLAHKRRPMPVDASHFEQLLKKICAEPVRPQAASDILEWLIEHTGCSLVYLEENALLERLRGRHVHVWQEGECYQILVVGHDDNVLEALQELARLEAECHAHKRPQLVRSTEGYLFSVEGENAFIFARLFLALEEEIR